MDALRQLILDPQYRDILAIVKGTRNGLVYGVKIRFPHALVMSLLFRSGRSCFWDLMTLCSFKDHAKFILTATKQHSFNLGKFVFIYKSLMYLQRLAEGKERNHHAFLAGIVGGYFVFGTYNNINYQIVLYLFSRILIGMASAVAEQQKFEAPGQTYPVFAALVWGIVMWLFRHHRRSLQPSLQASMQYLYNDADTWDSFRNFLWHNK